MGKIVEFKPKNTANKITSGKAVIIPFPNLNEYIDLFEETLNGRNDEDSIYEAFCTVNTVVSELDNPLEKQDQIFHFVEYFSTILDDEAIETMKNKLQQEDFEIFEICDFLNEENIINYGLNLAEDIDEDFLNVLQKIASYACIKIQNETLIEYFSGDKGTTYDIYLEQRSKEPLTERKAVLMYALMIRSHVEGGLFFIHEWKNKKDYLSGLIINTEGVFSINKKELQKNIQKNNQEAVCVELKLDNIIF